MKIKSCLFFSDNSFFNLNETNHVYYGILNIFIYIYIFIKTIGL